MAPGQMSANLIGEWKEEGSVGSVLERTEQINTIRYHSCRSGETPLPSVNLVQSISLPVQLLEHLGGSLARLGQRCKHVD